MEYEDFQRKFDTQASSDNWRKIMSQLTRKQLEEFFLCALSRRKRLETELEKAIQKRRL